jgi:GNAT superfamily N-acetyltransferase
MSLASHPASHPALPTERLSGRSRTQILEAIEEHELVEVAWCMTEFLSWMRERYAGKTWFVDACFDGRAWDDELRSLGRRYAAPTGAVLLARVDGRRAGCAMFHDLGDGVCATRGLFVRPKHQGQGIGRMLTRAVVSIARLRGYQRMRLALGPLQPEALELYESVGFRRVEPTRSDLEDRPALILMERGL